MHRVQSGITRKTSGFGQSEDGSLTVFSLVLFFLMIAMAGIAIDVMRFETTRTALSNTLDRCTLMAASMDQRLDPQSVVEDCVEKAGFADQIGSITVTETLNSRDVRVTAVADTEPMFLHMIGIDKFDAHAVSAATQNITNVELSLVLDVSGSMQGAKLTNLKAAASDFVQTVLQNDMDGRTSISLVPYNGQVNLGPTLRAQYTTTNNHGVADVNCVDLPASVYATTGISPTLPLPMTAHADSFTPTSAFNGYLWYSDWWAQPWELNRWCPPMPGNIVRPLNNDIATLQAQINGLTAIGATSINAGLKWGLTLLDPGTRGVVSNLVGSNLVPDEFDGRPFDYEDPRTMKVIVLMTDGAHFSEERINAGYRTGNSPIWRSNGDGHYSIHHSTRPGPQYYVPHLNIWQAVPWNSGAGVQRQTWQQVWGNQRVAWVAWQLYARALGTDDASRNAQYTAAMNMFRSQTAVSTMDAQLQQICNQAKGENVIIYGIAFEAPVEGQAQIAACSSSEQHYFDAQGLEIAAAFEAIASNLSMLRLTQ